VKGTEKLPGQALIIRLGRGKGGASCIRKGIRRRKKRKETKRRSSLVQFVLAASSDRSLYKVIEKNGRLGG